MQQGGFLQLASFQKCFGNCETPIKVGHSFYMYIVPFHMYNIRNIPLKYLRSSENHYLKWTSKNKRESTSHQRVADIARAKGTAIEQLLQFDVTDVT